MEARGKSGDPWQNDDAFPYLESESGVGPSAPSIEAAKYSICQQLKKHSCYDLLSVSSKLCVFDTSLLVKKALAALIQHGLQSAPLWDSTNERFAGMLSVTDFIHLIYYYYHHSSYEEALEEIEILKIRSLEEIERKINAPHRKIDYIHPMKSLYEAARIMSENTLHRLPLVERDTDNNEMIISVLSQYKILKFIGANCNDKLRLQRTLQELNIGNYKDIVTARVDTPLIQVIENFKTHRISAIPILDENDRVLDVYEKYDVMLLAKEGAYYDLEVPVAVALQRRTESFEGIHTCAVTDTLYSILETIKRVVVHRFIVVDSPESNKLVGVAACSDILSYLVS